MARMHTNEIQGIEPAFARSARVGRQAAEKVLHKESKGTKVNIFSREEAQKAQKMRGGDGEFGPRISRIVRREIVEPRNKTNYAKQVSSPPASAKSASHGPDQVPTPSKSC